MVGSKLGSLKSRAWWLTTTKLTWPMANFKLLGITYLVGKIKFKLLFQGPLAKWEKVRGIWKIVASFFHLECYQSKRYASWLIGWAFAWYPRKTKAWDIKRMSVGSVRNDSWTNMNGTLWVLEWPPAFSGPSTIITVSPPLSKPRSSNNNGPTTTATNHQPLTRGSWDGLRWTFRRHCPGLSSLPLPSLRRSGLKCGSLEEELARGAHVAEWHGGHGEIRDANVNKNDGLEHVLYLSSMAIWFYVRYLCEISEVYGKRWDQAGASFVLG